MAVKPSFRILACLLAAGLAGCGAAPETPRPRQEAAALPADIEDQVRAFCGAACHAYPEPANFPRRHWRAEVERGFSFFDRSGLGLDPPRLAHVVRYYEDRAPEEYPWPDRKPSSRPCLVSFETLGYPPPEGGPKAMISHVLPVRIPPPGVTDPAAIAREPVTLVACDMAAGRVLALRPADPMPQWRELGKVPHPAHAEMADLDGDKITDFLVADLGSFGPTDRKCGSVVLLKGQADGSYKPMTLLKDVGRVADVRAADFRGTGRPDLVVGVFGLHSVGEILLLENNTADWARPSFASRVLDDRHGAIHVPVTDLNGDGRPDFVALIAQEHEVVVAFTNDGKGAFTEKTIYRAPHPGWGSSGIQMVDMNADGRTDVLMTNGDILDEPYLWKPYHGIQWLENLGGQQFAHRRIADMHGVHHAVAARITGGPLPDVLAVSFLPADKFPDRKDRDPDAVVLFEQVAPGRFERHTLARLDCDAVCCAVADIWGTGRLDLVVGNFSSTRTNNPVTIWRQGPRGPARP